MNQPQLPEYVLDDLSKFISTYYREYLPHPMLIAQKFCLQYREYGKNFAFSTITEAIEQLIEKDNT